MKKYNATAKPVLDGYLQLLYLRAKVKWAEWMHRQSLRLGRRGRMISLAAFTCIFGACCLLLIFSGGAHLSNGPFVQPDRIVSIRAPDEPEFPAAVPDTLLLNQIAAFKSYLQDIEASESGRKVRDSLLKARPGLMDSIRMAESIIKIQKEENHEK